MLKTFYPTPDDYKPMEGTYESKFRNRLDCFDSKYRATICNDDDLRFVVRKIATLIGNGRCVQLQHGGVHPKQKNPRDTTFSQQ